MCAIAYATNAALPRASRSVIARWTNFFTYIHPVLSICPKMVLMTWIGLLRALHLLLAQRRHIKFDAWFEDVRKSPSGCGSKASVALCLTKTRLLAADLPDAYHAARMRSHVRCLKIESEKLRAQHSIHVVPALSRDPTTNACCWARPGPQSRSTRASVVTGPCVRRDDQRDISPAAPTKVEVSSAAA